MKTVCNKILKDFIKRYLPLIINALCASICVTSSGCALAAKDLSVSINPITKGE